MENHSERISAGFASVQQKQPTNVFNAEVVHPPYSDLVDDAENHIVATATSHGELLTGVAGRAFRNYRRLLPDLEDGVLKLDINGRFAVIPLPAAVDYFANPEEVAQLLDQARQKLVDEWNAQPDQKKFALEWSEVVSDHAWVEDRNGGEDGDVGARQRTSVLLILSTFRFTNWDRRRVGDLIRPDDVQVYIKLRSSALYQGTDGLKRSFVDGEGRLSDKVGYAGPSTTFLEFIRQPQFLAQVIQPSWEFLERDREERLRRRQDRRRRATRGAVRALGKAYRAREPMRQLSAGAGNSQQSEDTH